MQKMPVLDRHFCFLLCKMIILTIFTFVHVELNLILVIVHLGTTGIGRIQDTLILLFARTAQMLRVLVKGRHNQFKRVYKQEWATFSCHPVLYQIANDTPDRLPLWAAGFEPTSFLFRKKIIFRLLYAILSNNIRGSSEFSMTHSFSINSMSSYNTRLLTCSINSG